MLVPSCYWAAALGILILLGCVLYIVLLIRNEIKRAKTIKNMNKVLDAMVRDVQRREERGESFGDADPE